MRGEAEEGSGRTCFIHPETMIYILLVSVELSSGKC